MKAITLLGIFAIAITTPVRADAQAAPSSGKSITSAITSAFQRPLHPIVGGIAPGGGIGFGLEQEFPARGPWETRASALATVLRYWSALLETGYVGDRSRLQAYARVRDMSRLDFFSPGIAGDPGSRTSYRLRESTVGAVASVRLIKELSIGGRVEELWPDVGRGRSPNLPSIEERFNERDAPGLLAQPRFGRYQTFVEMHVPAGAGEALLQDGAYRIAYGLYDDQQFNQFTFRQLDVEGRQKFAVFGPHRRLTLHTWISAADTSASHDVPFFLQRTLGGKGNLRSVGEELIGSDGIQATLRGFRNFRFRDRNLMLLQAEYRVPIWGPFDVTGFVDAGKVTSRRSDLFNWSDLRHNYGFSASVMRGPNTVARMDIGFGGGEGTRFAFTFGGGF